MDRSSELCKSTYKLIKMSYICYHIYNLASLNCKEFYTGETNCIFRICRLVLIYDELFGPGPCININS